MAKNPSIHKYKSWEEIPETDLEYWLRKTPDERLAAAKSLIARAKKTLPSQSPKQASV